MTVPDRVQDQIAIVGLSGRFPGAPDLSAFWANLAAGVESLLVYSDEELRDQRIDRARLTNPSFVPVKSHLEDQELFDAGFFGYSPLEAEIIDPQHRLFLECAWEALEHAGYVPEAYPGPIALFAGSNQNMYLWFNLLPRAEFLDRHGPLRTIITNGADYLATRAAYKLNLTGPCCTVQTACSTSLVAVHMACQSLLNFECDLALAGGVGLNVSPYLGYTYEAGGLLSRDGHTRPFDANAGGTVFGEGVGLVVLKRMEDALADGDTIHAVVLGSAVNNDGSAKAGFTALGTAGQAAVVHQAIENAGVAADSISYIEAHGTATELGDAIEVKALTMAFRNSTARNGFCAIGSVKSNIGHLTAAAGIAGLIKTVLAMQHRRLPPTLHFERPNPNIDFPATPFFVNDRLMEWSSPGQPRRAGINAFGIGGTNAHVVIEEAPPAPAPAPGRPSQVIVLSARSEAALTRARQRLADHLRTHPDLPLADVAFTLATGRKAFRCRFATVGTDAAAVASALESSGSPATWVAAPRSTGQAVVFLCPGDAIDAAETLRDAADVEPSVTADARRLCAALRRRGGIDLEPLLWPGPGQAESSREALRRPSNAEPAAVIVGLVLAGLWMRWGVKPVGVLGSGVGEYVAGCVAGVFGDEDAVALAAAHGALVETSQAEAAGPPGAAFRASLAKVALKPPVLPFVSSVAGDWMTAEMAIDREYWVDHARGRSVSDAALNTLIGPGDRVALHIGPGTSLHDRVQAHPSATVWFTSGGAAEVTATDGLLATLARLWVSGVDLQWSAVSGTERRRRVPLPTYPFERRRYWSDPFDGPAATPAEPALRLGVPDDVADWFSVTVWRESTAALQTHAASNTRPAGGCLMFADATGVADALAETLGESGQWTVRVTPGSSFARPADRQFVIRPDAREDYERLFGILQAECLLPDRHVHLWSVAPADAAASSVASCLRHGVGSVACLAKVIEAQPGMAARVIVVTTGAMRVVNEEARMPERIAAIGPLRALARQRPHVSARCVDVDDPRAPRALSRLARQIAAEFGIAGDGDLVALRSGRRWIARREAVSLRGGGARTRVVPEGTWCVMTGATEGPGRALAVALAHEEQARLVLVEPETLPDRPEWNRWIAEHGEADTVSQRIGAIARLEALGASVATVAAEGLDAAALRAAVGRAAPGPIGAVIHASALAPARASSLERRMAEARTLIDAVKDDPVAFMALCTSPAAERGAAMSGDASAFHAYLSALAQGGGIDSLAAVVAIACDVWEPARDGVPGLEPAQALDALARVVAARASHVTISPWRDADPAGAAGPARPRAPQRAATTPAASAGGHPRPDLGTPYVAPASSIEREVARLWTELLGLDRVGVDDHFIELGGDSLLAAQVIARLRGLFQVDISLREVMDQPTVRRIAAGIAARALGDGGSVLDLVLELDGLSDEEAAERLRALQANPTLPS